MYRYMLFLKDGEMIGHTELLTEEELKDSIADAEEDGGYDIIMAIDVLKMLDPENDSISDITFDWR